jgi:hypothetical protein
MRFHFAALGLCGLLLAAPAAADVTIRYAPDPPGERALVIEVDGQGRMRAEMGSGQSLIRRDGETFVIVTRPDEAPVVARLDDFLAAAAERGREIARSGGIRLRGPAADTHYRLSERGPEAVGAWHGTRLAIEEIGRHDPHQDTIWVVSNDPALAAAAPAVAWFFEIEARIIADTMGAFPAEYVAAFRQLNGRGTPLRVYNFYRLDRLSADPVPAARFDLPGPVLSPEQLLER